MKRFRFSAILRSILMVCLIAFISGAFASLSAQVRNPDNNNRPNRGGGGNNIGKIIGTFGPAIIKGLQNAEKEKRRKKTRRVRRTPQKRKPERRRRARVRNTPPAIVILNPPLPDVPPDRRSPQIFADTPPLPLQRAGLFAEQAEFRASEVVLLIRGEDADETAADIENDASLVLQDSISLTLLGGARIFRFGIPDDRTVDEVLAEIAGTANVELAVRNSIYRLQGDMGGATSYAQQYALPKMHIPDAQGLVNGEGITVAVLDSRADISHPALRNANMTELDALKHGIDDPHEHGTAITGIIAASGDMIGIAPKARIISVRAFAPEQLGAAPITTVYALIDAIDKSYVEGARIFNMSFAGAENALFIEMIDDAYERGAIFVAAAGNEGPDAPPAYPAAHDKVIAITATDEADQLFEGANRGGYVLAAAPGVEIFAPVAGNGFDFLSGTSFAAAHVTGIIALLMERNPKLTGENIRDVLVEAAEDLGPDGRDRDYGAGLANAFHALELAERLE
ncbi:MAG: S8 family serine peptidase [Hyphomicrobiales bacterium]|nr:S8 family serine peptidase [Hyphomicrobiales bacterium]